MNNLLCAIMAACMLCTQCGCQCNNSRVHSALSDDVIERRLKKQFEGAASQEEKIQRALELIDTGSTLGVFEQVDGNAVHLIVARRAGCQLFYPVMPDANLLVHFDESNHYSGFDRWELSGSPRIEYKWDSQEIEYTYLGSELIFQRVDNGHLGRPRLENPDRED